MAYSYYGAITVDNTKVSGSTNLSNFPVLVSSTYDGTGGEPDIRVTGSGGNVQNVDSTATISGANDAPADLAFFADTGQVTQLDHEIQYYDSTTGQIIAWVRVPTLDYNDDTTIYMFYGDASVTTSQENINAVWSSVFMSVYHFQYAGGYDSVGANVLSTEAGTVAYNSGKIGNAMELDGSNSGIYNNTNGTLDFPASTEFYVSNWVNADNFSSRATATILTSADITGGSNFNISFAWFRNGSNAQFATNTRNDAWIKASTSVNINNWHFGTASYDGSTTVSFTTDGSADGTPSENSVTKPSDTDGVIGINFDLTSGDLDGHFDETRFALSDLGNDWGITEFNSMNSPSTFYSMGSETAAPAGGIAASKRSINVG